MEQQYMLLIVVLIMALIKGVMAFILGAALALGLWFIGIIARLRVPAWIRWGGSAVLVALHLYYFRRPVTRPPSVKEVVTDPIADFYLSVGAPFDGNMGWDAWQYDLNLLCIGLALSILVVIGIFVSLTKTAVRTVVKVASVTTSKSQVSEPPMLPPAS